MMEQGKFKILKIKFIVIQIYSAFQKRFFYRERKWEVTRLLTDLDSVNNWWHKTQNLFYNLTKLEVIIEINVSFIKYWWHLLF